MMWRKFSVSEFIRQNIAHCPNVGWPGSQVTLSAFLKSNSDPRRSKWAAIGNSCSIPNGNASNATTNGKPKHNVSWRQKDSKLSRKGATASGCRVGPFRCWQPYEPCKPCELQTNGVGMRVLSYLNGPYIYQIPFFSSFFAGVNWRQETFFADFECLAKVQRKVTTAWTCWPFIDFFVVDINVSQLTHLLVLA